MKLLDKRPLEEFLRKSANLLNISIDEVYERSLTYFQSMEGYRTLGKSSHYQFRILEATKPEFFQLKYELNEPYLSHYMWIDSVIEVRIQPDERNVNVTVVMKLRWPRHIYHGSLTVEDERSKVYWADFIRDYWQAIGVKLSPVILSDLFPPESEEWRQKIIKEKNRFQFAVYCGCCIFLIILFVFIWLSQSK